MSKLGGSIEVIKLEASLFDNMIPSLDASEVCPSEMEFADTSLSSTVFNESSQFAILGKIAWLHTLSTSMDAGASPHVTDKT